MQHSADPDPFPASAQVSETLPGASAPRDTENGEERFHELLF